ncbi:polynucleotide adenylyltransferase PcnB [bacterium]|nr:polynucleotide adenylyltransferase PcnB [bacterium]
MNLKTNEDQGDTPHVLSRDHHAISRVNIDSNALKVLYRLHRSGYIAYLVGGSVRDLMLGRKPKDFDVATDARPSKIKKLFRNAILIGRRFRLAHIRFKTGLIEVSTFRKEGSLLEDDSTDRDRISRMHNTFGSPCEDAFRRDFTINALYYNIANFTIIDYTGGLHDLKCGLIRAIGDPIERFGDDPVRMIRAIRAATRVGFAIEASTFEAICAQHKLILTSSPSRLFEEMQILLKMGGSRSALKYMMRTSLFSTLFPEIATIYERTDPVRQDLFFKLFGALDWMTNLHGEQSGQILWGTMFLACLFLQLPLSFSIRRDSDRLRRVLEDTFRIIECIGIRYSIPRRQRSIIRAILQDFPYLLYPKPGSTKFRNFPKRSHFQDAMRLLAIFGHATGRLSLVLKWERP